MARNANTGWAQSAPAGYAPAATFRPGSISQTNFSNDADVSYLLGNATGSQAYHPSYEANPGYQANNSRFAALTESESHQNEGNVDEQYWSDANQQHSNQEIAENDAPAQDSPDNIPTGMNASSSRRNAPGEWRPSIEEMLSMSKEERAKLPRKDRRKLIQPRPPASDERMFRPFSTNEALDRQHSSWRMVPVLGSYMFFPNKRLRYNPLPPDVDYVRERLFNVDRPVLLKNSQEVADYVPHLSNLWRYVGQESKIDEDTGVQIDNWHCRSTVRTRTKAYGEPPKGLRKREKKVETVFGATEPCKMRLRVLSFTKHAGAGPHDRWGQGTCRCVAEWVYFQRNCEKGSENTQHTHDMDLMDSMKRSEALAVLAKTKCEEGNSFAATSDWVREKFEDRSRQIKFLNKVDVSNASHEWRAAVPNLNMRFKVPEEDSQGMATMRQCVDAITEADADALRAALREVIQDSAERTSTALEILRKKKPRAPTPSVEEEPEPWYLAEGVGEFDLPSPGAPRKLLATSRVEGPFLDDSLYPPRTKRKYPIAPPPPLPQPLQWMAPNHPPQQPPPNVSPGPSTNRNQAHQNQPTQPRPSSNPQNVQNHPQVRPPPPPPQATGPPALGHVQWLPAPPPPQKGSVHPVTVSIEVSSCKSTRCLQCRNLDRNVAGRVFFFQDKLQSPQQYASLRGLLLDPHHLLSPQHLAARNFHPPPPTPQPPAQSSGASRPQAAWQVAVPPPGAQHAVAVSEKRKRGRPRRSSTSQLADGSRNLSEVVVVDSDEENDAGASESRPTQTSIYEQALPIQQALHKETEVREEGEGISGTALDDVHAQRGEGEGGAEEQPANEMADHESGDEEAESVNEEADRNSAGDDPERAVDEAIRRAMEEDADEEEDEQPLAKRQRLEPGEEQSSETPAGMQARTTSPST